MEERIPEFRLSDCVSCTSELLLNLHPFRDLWVYGSKGYKPPPPHLHARHPKEDIPPNPPTPPPQRPHPTHPHRLPAKRESGDSPSKSDPKDLRYVASGGHVLSCEEFTCLQAGTASGTAGESGGVEPRHLVSESTVACFSLPFFPFFSRGNGFSFRVVFSFERFSGVTRLFGGLISLVTFLLSKVTDDRFQMISFARTESKCKE